MTEPNQRPPQDFNVNFDPSWRSCHPAADTPAKNAREPLSKWISPTRTSSPLCQRKRGL